MFYLISTAGHPNYGDELIARSWLCFLAKYRPDDEVWSDCPEPGSASVLFQGVNTRAHFTNTVWRTIHEAPVDSDGFPEESHIKRTIEHLGSPRFDMGLLKLREAQSIHLLGGGYIMDIWAKHRAILASMVATGAVSGARLYATGLGIMPTANPGKMREMIERFDHFSVRDRPSALALGLPTGLDDVFLGVLDELKRAPRGQEVPDLVLCLQTDLAQPERFSLGLQIAREEIAWARKESKIVRYIEAFPGSDWRAYEQLQDLPEPTEFVPFLDVWRHGFTFSAHQRWVTSRFHYHFLAAAAGAQGTAIEVHQGYYDVKHRSLIELGTQWTVNKRSPQASTAHEFKQKLHERVTTKTLEAQTLYPPMTQYARR